MKVSFLLLFLLAACAHKTYQPSEPAQDQGLLGGWTMEKPAYFHLDGQDMLMNVRVEFTENVMQITSECSIEKLKASDTVSVGARIKLLPNHRFDVLESVNISKKFTAKKKPTVFTCNASYQKGIVNYVIKEDKLTFLDPEGRVDVVFVRRAK